MALNAEWLCSVYCEENDHLATVTPLMFVCPLFHMPNQTKMRSLRASVFKIIPTLDDIENLRLDAVVFYGC